MSYLKIYQLTQTHEWDAIVRSFTDYDVYYLSGYVKAFKIHGDGEPLLFYYNANDLRGINVVMKRDIAKDQNFIGKLPDNTYYDFATPYGYGGWLIEGSGDTAVLFKEYETWCINNNVISEFVRFHPILKNHEKVLPFYEVMPLGETIAMDLSTPEIIWDNLTSKNRNMIRKAQKSGVCIYNGRMPNLYEIFHDIYNSTMDKDHADNYYYFSSEFYKSLLMDLPANAQVFYADLNGMIIAASIILAANGRLNYHLSGSLKEYNSYAPTNLLLYHTALWGCFNGCKTFHLGGGVGSKDDNLFKFKRAFYRGELQHFFIGRRVLQPELYEYLLSMRGRTVRDGYFPSYRA